MTTTATLPTVRYNYYDEAPLAATQTPAPFDSDTARSTVTSRVTRAAQVRMDQTRYWTGAVLTAVVAALVGGIGMVIAHGIIRVPVLFDSAGVVTSVSALTYGLIAVAVALVGAAVYDAMLYLAPRPLVFYTWIAGLLTALAVLVPFTSTVAHSSQIALAAMNLVVGLTVMILVPVAAENARTTR